MNKEKQFMVWFKPSPIFAKNQVEAEKKAFNYMEILPDDWIEIDNINEQK